MALDLLSEEGLRGEIPRRYRHEAEPFAWSLICLCLATVENKKGKNFTMDPHPLYKWFEDWKSSRDATAVLQTIETLALLTRTQSLFTFGAPVTLFVGHRMCS